MNLPNKLTVARIALVPVFALFAELACHFGGAGLYLVAGIVFAIASLTDMLDGRIARRRNLITDFGKFADPLADKILTTAAFIYMLLEGVCAPAVLILVLFREFAVSGLRMVAAGAKDGRVLAANMWGKVKTAVQMVSIVFFYFGRALFPAAGWVDTMAIVLCWICGVLTAVSGVKYFLDNRQFFSEMK
ncbi:MAG: CDP-diacylglycerol--glycerol-3-phosphate 3-phosphatidyltransferase [Oscillospiraceae bacterium]|nr:CDP-diacylglycerol--glycerol-3-phosphate 3-phosphatidyltransferase [Oscillospiraceae bacterium]